MSVRVNDALYRQVYRSLRARIQDGEYEVGQNLPRREDLAAEYSVSAITLSKALEMLRDEGFVSTRPRLGTTVLSAQPTQGVPQVVRAGDRPVVGFVITAFDDTFGVDVLNGVLSEVGEANVLVKTSLGSVEREREALRELTEAGVHGLIVLPTSSEFVAPEVLGLAAAEFPVVLLDRYLPGVSLSAVSSDNEAGAVMAVEHVVSHGHSSIGYLQSTSHVTSTADRLAGFVRAHAELQLTFDEADVCADIRSVLPDAQTPAQDDIDLLAAFVSARPQVTAYVASEHGIGLLLLKALESLGLRCPEDVSVVVFDQSVDPLDDSTFRFAAVQQRQHEMGRLALQQVVRQLADPQDVQRHTVPVQLIPGASVARPSTGH